MEKKSGVDKIEPAMAKNSSFVVREMINDDIEYFIDYWLDSSPDFLIGMGVDVAKRPTKQQLLDLTSTQIEVPIKNKTSYFLTWLNHSIPVGCSNVNQIEIGKQAFMHLHLYESNHRRKGMGTEFVKKSLPFYFKNLKLKELYCEPYALNPAPNRTLEKVGFDFVKQYITIPGASNFEQTVNRWKLTRDTYEEMILIK